MDKLIRTFLEIARSGSLTAAATRLNITQPSLTKRLRQLEDAYGTPLFKRGVSGAKPTPAGAILLEYAERIEAEFRQSHEAVEANRTKRMAVLKIGAGPLFHLRFMAVPILAVARAHPETRVELVTGLYRETMADLAASRLDIVFGAHESQALPSQLIFVKLTEVEQGVALRAGHPLAQAAHLDAKTLAGLEWIVYGKRIDDAALLNGFFHRAGVPPPQPRFVTGSFTTGLQAVAQSDAAMMVPVSLLPALQIPGLVLHKTEPPIALTPAGAFMRRATRGFPVVETMLASVMEIVGAAAPEQSLLANRGAIS